MPDYVLDLSDEMIERAVLAGSRAEGHCPDGTPCAHTDCHYRTVIEAAFEGVPMSNYAIGLLLQQFELVIIARDGETQLAPQVGVFRANQEPHSFDKLGHTLNVGWSEKPRRHISRVAVSKLDPPAGIAPTQSKEDH